MFGSIPVPKEVSEGLETVQAELIEIRKLLQQLVRIQSLAATGGLERR